MSVIKLFSKKEGVGREAPNSSKFLSDIIKCTLGVNGSDGLAL